MRRAGSDTETGEAHMPREVSTTEDRQPATRRSNDVILNTPCGHCGVLRGEHELGSLMQHALMLLGMSETEANEVCQRAAERLKR
jgi:hypothetical protein